ncbi:histone deacetylase family protein [Desulfobulbus alkaliphilus]|uniref:histone deacetylase family protein n=1 Tax=Desulfobulbus alkaliphilus TaxID=869814 RepID=UPI0019623EFF|nr:histone deacetylase [Desulfobulbus alkaliphilus]MBM9536766.1 histone deacetylase [Desulfobulbus alkaliphilus]
MRKTAVYKNDLFLAHDTGREHIESAARLQAVYQELERDEIAAKLIYPSWKKSAASTVQLIHSREHVQAIAATANLPATFLDADTRASADSYQAALLAVGAVVDGLTRLHRGEIDNGFCLVRPPGHHAERHRAMGFCLFNNIAVGARWAIRKLGAKRIMIIDWDLHHGNGTQHSFYQQDTVLYCSLHQYPLYPGTGALPESGQGRGGGFTVNIPLAAGRDDEEYARIINELVIPLARAYRPEYILVSCGFDIMAGDPTGTMRVSPAGIAYMTRALVDLAAELCGGRLLYTLEGGYDRDNMLAGILAVLSELYGAPLADDHPLSLSREEYDCFHTSRKESAALDQALSWIQNWWQI